MKQLLWLLLILSESICSGQELLINEGDSNFQGLIFQSVLGDGTKTFIGTDAGIKDVSIFPSLNTFIGSSAGKNNTTGRLNTFIGNTAGQQNTMGLQNTFIGQNSGTNNTIGEQNTFVGRLSGVNNIDGNFNTFIGWNCGSDNEGNGNAVIGYNSGKDNAGNYNCIMGYFSGSYSGFAENNVYLGSFGGKADDNNVAIGYSSASFMLNGNNDNSTYIGFDADNAFEINYFNSMALGNGSRVTGSNLVRIGNSTVTSIGGYVNWTNISDGRIKKDINENVPGLDFILKLRPVTYKLKMDLLSEKLNENNEEDDHKKNIDKRHYDGMDIKKDVVYTGLIAQDVKQSTEEIGYNFSGIDCPENEEEGLYGIRYSSFVAPLIKAVQEQNTIIQDLLEELKVQNSNIEQKLEKVILEKAIK